MGKEQRVIRPHRKLSIGSARTGKGKGGGARKRS